MNTTERIVPDADRFAYLELALGMFVNTRELRGGATLGEAVDVMRPLPRRTREAQLSVMFPSTFGPVA